MRLKKKTCEKKGRLIFEWALASTRSCQGQ